MGLSIAEAIAARYPLAKQCQHKLTHESLYQEASDDRYYYYIITRCDACHFPMDERDASTEEAERILHG